MATTTDRAAVIAALTPTHESVITEVGIDPKMLRRAQQVHGNKVALVGDIGCSYPVEGVDGLFCGRKADCCLGIYVADCAAVWLYDTVTGARGLVHSGKLGTQQNIVGEALAAMKKILGVQPINCLAVISPASARRTMRWTSSPASRRSSRKRGSCRKTSRTAGWTPRMI